MIEEEMFSARRAWHRRLGMVLGQACPSGREAESFDTGFAAAAAVFALPDPRVPRLENEREVLLNALCQAVEIITGKFPNTLEIRRRFLETGDLPLLTKEGD